MSHFDSPDRRLRRIAQSLLSSQARQEKLRNAAAELYLRGQASKTATPPQRGIPTRTATPSTRETVPTPTATPLPRRGVPTAAPPLFGGQPTPVALAPGVERPQPGFFEQAAGLGLKGLQLATSPVLPEERFQRGLNRLEGVPVVGQPLSHLSQYVTSPLGLATAAVAPAGHLAGLGGALALGSAGQAVEEAGAPNIPTPFGEVEPSTAGELIGGLLTPTQAERIGTTARAGVRRAGENLAESGGARALPGRLAREERGSLRFAQPEEQPIGPTLEEMTVPERPPPPPEEPPTGPPAGEPPPQTPFEFPPDEKIQRAVTRRFAGEVRLQGDRLRVAMDDITRQARREGVKLTRTQTPEAERLTFAMDGSVPVESLPPAEQATANQLKNVLRQEQEAMLAADPSFDERLLDEYFPHFFKKATKPRPAISSRLGVKPRFVKGRTLDGALAEILERRPDLDLVSWNPADMVQLRVSEGIRYRAGLELRNRLEGAGFAKPISQAPDDWVVPDLPLFKTRKLVGVAAEERPTGGRIVRAREDTAVPPDIADYLNDAFGTSLFSKNKALRAWRTGVGAAKLAKTFGGLFQTVDYGFRQLGVGTGEAAVGRVKFAPRSVGVTVRALGRGFVPSIDRRMLRFDTTDPLRSALLENGIQTEGGLDIFEREMRDALADSSFLARKGITDNLATKRAKDVANYLSDATFLKQHREHVLSAGEIRAQAHIKAGDSLPVAAAKAAAEINEQFSAIPNWQSVIRDPTFRDFARSLFFSPNETEAWFRNFFRVIPGKNFKASAVRFWVGMGINAAVLANMVHLASTGQLLPADRYNPISGRKGDLGIPVSFNTQFLRPNLPWKGPLGREQYLDILGQADTPFRFALSPIYGTRSRLSQPARLALETSPVLTGQEVRDFSGRPVTSPSDFGQYAAEQVVPIPGQSFLTERGRIGDIGAATQAAGVNVSAEPLSGLLKRKYEEIYGAGSWDSTASTVRSKNIRENPELSQIQEKRTETSAEFGPAYRQTVQQINADTQAKLIGAAQGISRGEPQAFASYAKTRGDVLAEARARKDQEAQSQGITFDEREADARVDAYLSLEPTDKDGDGYLDDEDMRAFFDDRDELFDNLTPEEKVAVKDPSRWLTDPTAIAAEKQYQRATEAREQYFNIPKYEKTSLAEGEKIEEYLAKARAFQRQQRNLGRTLELRAAIKAYARQTGTVERARKAISALKHGINPERQNFLAENPSLFLFFPDDFTPSLSIFENVSPEVAEQLIGVR